MKKDEALSSIRRKWEQLPEADRQTEALSSTNLCTMKHCAEQATARAVGSAVKR